MVDDVDDRDDGENSDSRESTTVDDKLRRGRLCGIVQYYQILPPEKLIPEGLVFRTGFLCGGW